MLPWTLVRARHQYPTGLRCFALVFSRRTVTLVRGINQFALQGYRSYNLTVYIYIARERPLSQLTKEHPLTASNFTTERRMCWQRQDQTIRFVAGSALSALSEMRTSGVGWTRSFSPISPVDDDLGNKLSVVRNNRSAWRMISSSHYPPGVQPV